MSLLTCDGEFEELEEAHNKLEELGHAGGDTGGLEEAGQKLVDLGDVRVSRGAGEGQNRYLALRNFPMRRDS